MTPFPVFPQPSVLEVAERVVAMIRVDDDLDAALDRYLRHPDSDNVRCRWLGKRAAYEVVLYLDVEPLTKETR